MSAWTASDPRKTRTYSRASLLALRDFVRRPALDVRMTASSVGYRVLNTIEPRLTVRRATATCNYQLSRGITYRHLVPVQRASTTETTPKLPTARDHAINPSLLLTNCRSINQTKFRELESVAKQNRPDLICLTETWMTEDKVPLIEMDGYQLFTSNRKNRIGGGVAIYTQDQLNASQVAQFTSATLSTLWLLLKRHNANPLLTGCVYHPPSSNRRDIEATQVHITETIHRLLCKHKTAQLLLCGDFNRLDTSPIESLYGLRQLVNFPTRESATLDLILTDITEYKAPVKLSPLSANDHCVIHLPGSARHIPKFTWRTKRFVTKEARANIVRDIASESWSNITQCPDLDTKVTNLYSSINTILDRHCPVKRIRVKKEYMAWQTPLMIKLRNAKNRAYRNGSPSWKYLAKLLVKVTRSAERDYHRHQLGLLESSNTAKWWKLIKEASSSQTTIPHRHFIEDQWQTTPELAENLNTYFCSVGGVPTVVESRTTRPQNQLTEEVSLGEVKAALKRINTKKATHGDDFPAWISKSCAEDMTIPVTNIINTVLETRCFPTRWKEALVKPLPKVSAPQVHKDYRPISLLHHLSKITEGMLMRRYRSAVLPKLNENQYAYQKGKSTTDALVTAIDDWTRDLDDKNTVCIRVALKDFSKAFDKMQHSRLQEVHETMKIPGNIIECAGNFLTGRTQRVSLHDTVSSIQPITVGVPQGTISGPLFWLAYCDSLQPPAPTETIKYADDTTCYTVVRKNDCRVISSTCTTCCISPTPDHIQEALDFSMDWCTDNHMQLNPTKTNILNLSVRKKISVETTPTVNGMPIQTVKVAKFLGVHIDEHLSFSHHVDAKVKTATKLNYCLLKLKRAGVNSSGLLRLYTAKIRTVVMYASAAWFTHLTKESIDKLEKVQRTAMKIIFPESLSYEARMQRANLTTIAEHGMTTCRKYFVNVVHDHSHSLHRRVQWKCTAARTTRSKYNVRYRTQLRRNSLLTHMALCSS